MAKRFNSEGLIRLAMQRRLAPSRLRVNANRREQEALSMISLHVLFPEISIAEGRSVMSMAPPMVQLRVGARSS